MLTVVYWNLNKKPGILKHVACLAKAHQVDVFLFAESPKNLKPAIRDLNRLGVGNYRQAMNAPAKVRAVTRLGSRDFLHRSTSLGREMAVWAVRAPKMNPPQVLLAGVHFPSKAGGNTGGSQLSVAISLANELVDAEDAHQHRNTVLAGDFNMNPYDAGMIAVTGFHGLMTKELATMPDRRHRGQDYRRFYNPMWGLFGDRTPGPAGTHYWRSSVIENPYWAMFDQVLLRPSLIGRLQALAILRDDGTHDLVGPDGAPDKRHLSDHLPILFSLDV
jgi:hypothetical protein